MDKIKITNLLSNDQLQLTLLKVDDANDIFQATLLSIDSLRKFPASLPWALQSPSVQNSIDYCQKCILEANRNMTFTYVIRLNISHRFVGILRLNQIQWDIPCVTLGFWGSTAFKKHGYMTQALELLIKYLKENLKVKRIEAFVDMENERAKKLCLRTGFVLDEVMENSAKSPIDATLKSIGIYVIT